MAPSNVPLVSVGIVTFNGASHIRDTLASLSRSTYPNIEAIVFDDGSSDETLSIAQTFCNSSMRIIEGKRNRGVAFARNQVMKEAAGIYMCWLDQDDLMHPSRIQEQVELMEARKEISVCGSWSKLLVQLNRQKPIWHNKRLPVKADAIRAHIPFTNPLYLNTVLMRLDDFRSTCLNFRSDYGNVVDYDLWARAADQMLVVTIPKYLGIHRIHNTQTSYTDASIATVANQIRVETIERNFSMEMSPQQRHTHALCTGLKPLFKSATEIRDTLDWLDYLVALNQAKKEYEQRAFEEGVARTWFQTVRMGLLSCKSDEASVEILRHLRTTEIGYFNTFRSALAALREKVERFPLRYLPNKGDPAFRLQR